MLLRPLPVVVLAILVLAFAGTTDAALRPESRCPQRCHAVGLQGAHGRSRAPMARASALTADVFTPACEDTQLTPTPEDLQAVRESILCLINQERARSGLSLLLVDPQLQQAAQAHSEQMVREDYFAHTSPSGETVSQRLQAAGYIPENAGYLVGENVAWGTLGLATPEAIVEAWVASPPHLANILEAGFRDTGIGVDPAVPAAAAEGVSGATYTQDFGVIDEGSATSEGAREQGQYGAPVSHRAPCRLRLSNSRVRIRPGERASVAGELLCPRGTGAGGEHIIIERRAAERSTRAHLNRLGTAAAEADGSFHFLTPALFRNAALLVQSTGGRFAREFVCVSPSVRGACQARRRTSRATYTRPAVGPPM